MLRIEAKRFTEDPRVVLAREKLNRALSSDKAKGVKRTLAALALVGAASMGAVACANGSQSGPESQGYSGVKMVDVTPNDPDAIYKVATPTPDTGVKPTATTGAAATGTPIPKSPDATPPAPPAETKFTKVQKNAEVPLPTTCAAIGDIHIIDLTRDYKVTDDREDTALAVLTDREVRVTSPYSDWEKACNDSSREQLLKDVQNRQNQKPHAFKDTLVWPYDTKQGISHDKGTPTTRGTPDTRVIATGTPGTLAATGTVDTKTPVSLDIRPGGPGTPSIIKIGNEEIPVSKVTIDGKEFFITKDGLVCFPIGPIATATGTTDGKGSEPTPTPTRTPDATPPAPLATATPKPTETPGPVCEDDDKIIGPGDAPVVVDRRWKALGDVVVEKVDIQTGKVEESWQMHDDDWYVSGGIVPAKTGSVMGFDNPPPGKIYRVRIPDGGYWKANLAKICDDNKREEFTKTQIQQMDNQPGIDRVDNQQFPSRRIQGFRVK